LAHFYNFNFPGEDYSNPYNDSWGAQAHVLRGGSWSSDDGGTYSIRSANRYGVNSPSNSEVVIGFRCASSP
jgi:formylglycine-generating enzyme required for sulfatase activity